VDKAIAEFDKIVAYFYLESIKVIIRVFNLVRIGVAAA